MNSIASITAPTTVHIKKVQRRQLATPSRGSQCCGRSLIELAFKRLFGKRLEADRVAKYCLELQKRKYTTRTVENRLTKLKSKVSTSTCSVTLWRLAVKYKLRQDSVHMMIILFAVIMSVVISENTALASQRDSIKQKNPNNLSTNLNAIPTGGGIGTSATNGNFANGNPNNNKHGGNDISNQRNNTTTVTSDYGGNYLTTSATTTQSTATATMTVPSNTSSAVYNGTAQKNSGAFLSGTSVMNRNTIELTEDARNGPYFDKAASKNITALLGKTAYLNCRVKNLGNKTMLLQVSWVRHRDIHLLTVGRYTYTSDQRFRAIHQPQTEDWILQIKYPQHRDSGIYECQVSTTPHMSHYIHLNVVEPSTEIIGAPDLYIESGSTINLTCVILNSPEPPAYIFWNHNNAIINYDSPRGGVSVVTNKGETTTSFLLIKSARPSDSGHYQCNPSNAKPKSVTVHVLNGVSHSVSRGIPSSNAARGSSVSSNVPKSVSPSVPVNVLVHLSVYQMVYAVIGDNWHQDSKHVKHLFEWILSAIVLLATELLGKRQLRRRKCEKFYDECGCYLNDLQLKSNESLQQQQKATDTEHKQRIVEETLTSLFQKSNPFITVYSRVSSLLKSLYSLLGRHNFEPDIR